MVCSGMVARRAALFSVKLCRARLDGIRNPLIVDQGSRIGEAGINTIYEDLRDQVMNAQREDQEEFVDDSTGQARDPVLVRLARQKELEYFKSKGVWVLQEVDKARKLTGRTPTRAHGVDVDNGDDQEPDIRSRLVAREVRSPGTEAVFAPTRP